MSERHILERDGLALVWHDRGGPGPPFLFQHGLGGDAAQTAAMVPDTPALRLITLECRGHGGSEAGDSFGIVTFADDLIALIEAQHLGPALIGGLSMGAAIACRVAVRRPDLVRGLILLRPAWVADAAPPNMAANAEVGGLLQHLPAAEAKAAFLASPTAALLAREAPDNLASLTGFFDRHPQSVTAALLAAISADGPGITRADLCGLSLPSLICGTDADLIHPFAHARTLAALIPRADLRRLPPKGHDRIAHTAAFQSALNAFLQELPDA